MPTERSSAQGRLIFDLPEGGGRLSFAQGDLDQWAEHLTWCYRLLGVSDGVTMAVQDFGTSPLAFLGSALLMPTLHAGVAERLGARFLCLDASTEKVTLTPALLRQVAVDVLVVRHDVVDLLLAVSRQAGVEIDDARRTVVVALGRSSAAFRPGKNWRYLLAVETALLLAPKCARCDSFHLRAGFYEVHDGRISNLRLPGAQSAVIAWLDPGAARRGGCDLGADDLLLRARRDTRN